jgi:hypothetical protein
MGLDCCVTFVPALVTYGLEPLVALRLVAEQLGRTVSAEGKDKARAVRRGDATPQRRRPRRDRCPGTQWPNDTLASHYYATYQ